VRFDGKTFRTRILRQSNDPRQRETLAGHHGAKVVVRVKCEIFPNCPRYVPDLMGASRLYQRIRSFLDPATSRRHRNGKSRDYLKDVLSSLRSASKTRGIAGGARVKNAIIV